MKRSFIISITNGVVIVLYSVLSGGCKKFVSIDPPRNQIVTSEVFSDSANATAAVVGIYVKMMNPSTSFNFGNGGITLYTGLSADELNATNGSPDITEFVTNSISATNEINRGLWTSAYPTIYQINECIDQLTSSPLGASIRNRLLGEVKFMRAYFYFNLIQLYGDVPLVLSTAYTENASMPRTSISTIASQIIKDLLEAEQLLLATYVSAGRVRPNKFTATALLARVYLYQQQWQKAEDAASTVINAGPYTLESDLNTVFLSSSKEAIFQLQPVQAGYGTAEGAIFNPTTSASSLPKYVLSPYLLNSFEAGDIRKTKWVKVKVVNGNSYAYPFKYKISTETVSTPTESYTLLRLGEQYLIRAEARLQLNKPLQALDDLNAIRLRAGLTGTSSSDPVFIASAIYQERRVEFFAECGHRWYDLKRWNMASPVLAPVKAPNWQTTDQLYPIPFAEMQTNPFLTQNPGY